MSKGDLKKPHCKTAVVQGTGVHGKLCKAGLRLQPVLGGSGEERETGGMMGMDGSQGTEH